MQPTFVIGDIHGYYDTLVALLRAAELIDRVDRWCGGDAQLWFMGDFFDRGPDGIGVVDLVMRLQREAQVTDGYVGALLGNHEPLILSAKLFGNQPTGWGGNFLDDWRSNGGQQRDLKRLDADRINWLVRLPAMALVADRLFMHADAMFYRSYGRSIDQVNRAFLDLLTGDHAAAWDVLLEQFTQRRAFAATAPGQSHQPAQLLAHEFLRQYGGRQIVHGHTPITKLTGRPVATITAPLVYASGLCVDVDGGIGHGGPGFVYELPLDDGRWSIDDE